MREARWLVAVTVVTSLVAGCTSAENVDESAGDAAVAGPDAGAQHDATVVNDASGSSDASVTHDASGAIDTGPGSDAQDAGAAVDAHDAATAIDAADSSVATDSAIADSAIADTAIADTAVADADDGNSNYDAFSFPDAQSLSGLRIGFLGNANSESLLDGYLATAATVSRIDTSADAGTPLDATLLAGFDVIILDQLVRAYTPTEAQAVADWVTAGGGVLSLTGYTGGGTDGTQPNSLLAPFGVQYATSQGIFSNSLITALVPHPVMDGVGHLKFSGGYAVTEVGVDAGIEAGVLGGGTDTIVAMIDGTHVALVAQDHGKGRVLVWGDEWIQYDSEFTGNQGTERFWNNAVSWLAHR